MTDSMPLPRPIFLGEFTPLVGGKLIADCDPDQVQLELVSASPLVNYAKLDRPPFILIFRSEPDALLMDGTYALRGEGFGPDLIHISRVATPIDGTPGHHYQAVFN